MRMQTGIFLMFEVRITESATVIGKMQGTVSEILTGSAFGPWTRSSWNDQPPNAEVIKKSREVTCCGEDQ